MIRIPLLVAALLAAAAPSALAAQTGPTVAQYEQEIAKVEAAIREGHNGGFVVERKVNGEAVPAVLSQEQFRAFVVQMVMTDEIDPSEVPAFIKAARFRSDRSVEDLEEQLSRLESGRMKAAVAEGGETLTRVRAEMYTPERLAGLDVEDIDKLHPAERYDILINRTGGMIERGQAGDFIIIQEVNGKRVPVAVTPSQFAQFVTEMVMLGELEPGEAPAFVAAARIYSVSALEELKDIRQGLTEKRDTIVRDIEAEISGDRETLARIAAEVRQNAPEGGVLAQAAERSRATAIATSSGSMAPTLRAAPPPPPPPPPAPATNYAAWMTGTFDTGGGVLTLGPGGGNYEYQNGRLRVTRIDGPVMEGIWEQDQSAGKCANGRYYGIYRLTFTENGFTGLFGYCEDAPSMPGGFHGTRRK
jgi:hypothetical protein